MILFYNFYYSFEIFFGFLNIVFIDQMVFIGDLLNNYSTLHWDWGSTFHWGYLHSEGGGEDADVWHKIPIIFLIACLAYHIYSLSGPRDNDNAEKRAARFRYMEEQKKKIKDLETKPLDLGPWGPPSKFT